MSGIRAAHYDCSLTYKHKNKVFGLLIKAHCGHLYHIGQVYCLIYWRNNMYWCVGLLYHHNGHCRHVGWKFGGGRWCLAKGSMNSYVSLIMLAPYLPSLAPYLTCNSVPRWQKVLTYGGLYPHKTLIYGHQTLGISNGGVYEAFWPIIDEI